MGQGVSTTLAALVAEELEVGLDQVKVEHGPADLGLLQRSDAGRGRPVRVLQRRHGRRGRARRDGRRRQDLRPCREPAARPRPATAIVKMREAGAATRADADCGGGARLSVAASATSSPKTARSCTRRREDRSPMARSPPMPRSSTLPSDVKLKDKADWKILGKPQQRKDMLAKVTGAPIFGIDVTLPDMLYGTVKMSPRFWAKPVKSDLSKAEKMPGVVKIVPIDTTYGSGFGVIAENTWAAFNAADAIEVEWGAAEYPLDSAAISKALQDALRGRRFGAARRRRCRQGLRRCAARQAGRSRIFRAVPRACVHGADERDGAPEGRRARRLVRRTSSRPWRGYLCADLAGVEQDKANVHTTFLGGGFGRRGEMDFSHVRDAARQGDRRAPGQGDLDARGGHAPRRLPSGSRRAVPRTARRRRHAGRPRHEDRLAVDHSQHAAPGLPVAVAARARTS